MTEVNCCVDNNMTAYKPNQAIQTSSWARYWLSIVDFGKIVNPGAVPSLSEGDQAVIPIAVPPLSEQVLITAFLDRETGKIDALVAEQERLMALLKEKRQAVISQAVTKGLDPNVPMKESGVEWLGAVPEQWDVTRLKFVTQPDGTGIQIGPFGGMLKDLPTEHSGYKLYGQQNVISGDFEAGDRWIREETFVSNVSYHVKPGDLFVTRKGSLGNCRVVPPNTMRGWFDSDTIRVRVDQSKIFANFLQLLLHEAAYIARQIDETRRGAILSGINSDVVANLQIVLPPPSAQMILLERLKEHEAQFNEMFATAKQAASLLKERRAALISAAVTGKIDVRGLVSTRREAA